MYKLDELVKLEYNNTPYPIITKENIALASLDNNILKELCIEVFKLLCKYDPSFDNLFTDYNEHFLLSLFGLHEETDTDYFNYYIDNISDDMIKIIYREEPNHLVSTFIDRIANDLHDNIVINITEAGERQEIQDTEDLVYKVFKAYESANLCEADINHLDNITHTLRNIVLHIDEDKVPIQELKPITVQDKIDNLKGIIQSIIQAVPINNTLLLIPRGNDRVVYYTKSEIMGYVEETVFLKANSDELRMDVKEGTSRIPITEFIELLPTLGL